MYRFLLILILSVPAAAQSTALLTGTVNDASGAVVPGAEVVLRNTETGMRSSMLTNAEGLFRFATLPVGAYEVTVEKPGFERLLRPGIELLTGQTLDLALTLTAGQVSTSVDVTGAVPLVQTTSSEVQTTVDSRQMADLPLNGRNTFDLAVLTPGSINTDASTVPGQADNTGLAVNGQRSVDNNWLLDGATYTNRAYGSAPSLPNPDTLQEFSVQSSNYSADTRGGGAAVKLTTRSGTNQFHGTAFEFLRNDAMDARNFFAVEPQVYKQNQYGATLGGPVRRNKVFFFASYQGTNKRGNPSPLTSTVPNAAVRTGDFSRTTNQIIDPSTGRQFPGNVIPQNRLDPIALKLIPYIPLPNSGANLLVAQPNGRLDDTQWLGKADYLASAKDHITVRYFRDDHTAFDNTPLPAFSGENNWINQTFSVSATHTFSPNWVLTAYYSRLQIDRRDAPTSAVTMQELGVQVPFANKDLIGKLIDVGITGYTTIATSAPQQMHPNSHEVQANVSHAAGRHLIRFGGSFQRSVDAETSFNIRNAGNWTYTAQRTAATGVAASGDAFASFLLGLPATFAQTSNSPTTYVMTGFDPWIQDDFRVSRTFTLNFGLRWEPMIQPYDSLVLTPGFLPGVQSTVAPLAPKGVVFPGDRGIPRAILQNFYNVFSPRAGFAWNVGNDHKTVVRGGYGIFRGGTMFDGLIRNIDSNAPFTSTSISINNPPSTANPYAGYPGEVPSPYTAPPSLASYVFPANGALRLLDANAHQGYTQSWNLTVERQLTHDMAISVAYVGNHAIGIMTRYQANPALFAPGATVANENNRRLYPGIGQLTLGSSVNHSRYNSLQTRVTKRTRHGLNLLTSFTWSRSMDIDSSGTFGTALAQGPRNPLDLDTDYTPSDFDAKFQFRIAAVYDLPVLRGGSAVVRGLVNGWQVNAMIVTNTGFPFSCRSGVDNSLTGIGNDNCDQISADSARPAGFTKLQKWFNTAAYAPNTIGTYGTAGRNNMRRPGLLNTNASLFRRFRVTEGMQLEFRAEAFNLLNHPNFQVINTPGAYTSTVVRTSPTFGQLTYAQDPRLLQLALKVRF